ncbi:MAG: autotransporter domain-containing protein [Chlamydiae bacterium]|nr:autotransporter domain-containing protein [Chlamydiota bacterium]
MKHIIIPCLCLALLQAEKVLAANSTVATYGLVGGQNGTAAYAAFVDENGNINPIDLGIPNGNIGYLGNSPNIVAINGSGIGLIGGQNGTAAYAAFVGPGSSAEPLTISISTGFIDSVAINSSGLGLIGGRNGSAAYAAFVGPGSSVDPLNLSLSNGSIKSVAINDSGRGLIGGIDYNTGAYAAFVVPGQAPLVLSNIPSPTGSGSTITSVAINSSGAGILGGYYYAFSPVGYAVLVAPNGDVTRLTLTLDYSEIVSVAINDSGMGLIGGLNGLGGGSYSAYTAFVVPGQITPTVLSGLPISPNSTITSVAINSTGAGILGGQGDSGSSYNASGFAALVAPNGFVTPLTLNLPNALIQSVAINDAGIGLLGGQNGSAAYAALVAPGVQVTPLDLQILSGSISGVAINTIGIFEAVTPKSIGSNWGVFNSQFAASFALNSHMTGNHRIAKTQEHQDIAFLASADDNLPMNSGTVDKSSQNPNTIWFSPFGNYVHQKAEGSNPSSNNSIGGFLVGYDYSYSDLIFGGALGYAYNYIGLGSGVGHGSVQEELATFYGSYKQGYLLLNFALWGGYYELYNKRNSLFSISSKANTEGWIFSPHLEVATPFKRGNTVPVFFEPFVMFDYVSNWQGGFTEKGSSGLNLVMDKHYSSVLRSEVGLRLLEEWNLKLGEFVFGQKFSYVNQSPFFFNSVTTSFVASASSFPVAIGGSQVQNLGAVEVNASFLPWNEKYPYISFGFQGEFGSSYQSYFGNLEIGRSF